MLTAVVTGTVFVAISISRDNLLIIYNMSFALATFVYRCISYLLALQLDSDTNSFGLIYISTVKHILCNVNGYY